MLRYRPVAVGASSILMFMVVSACGASSVGTVSGKLDPLGQQTVSTKSIVQCGMRAVAEPFAGTPNSLKRATQAYQMIDSTGDAVGALESVYGKTLFSFTYDEQAEALHILSGLDSCGEAGATAPGAIALLLSGQPGAPAAPNGAPAAPPAAAGQPAPAKPVSAPAVSPAAAAPSVPVAQPGPAARSAPAARPAAAAPATPRSVPAKPPAPAPPTNAPGKPPREPTTWICTLPKDLRTGSPSCVPVQPGQVPHPAEGEYVCQGRSIDACWLRYLSTVLKPGGDAVPNSGNTTSKNLNGADPDRQLRFGSSRDIPSEERSQNRRRDGGN